VVGGGDEGKRHLGIVVEAQSLTCFMNTRWPIKCKPKPLH
jgi:hypothetical protein